MFVILRMLCLSQTKASLTDDAEIERNGEKFYYRLYAITSPCPLRARYELVFWSAQIHTLYELLPWPTAKQRVLTWQNRDTNVTRVICLWIRDASAVKPEADILIMHISSNTVDKHEFTCFQNAVTDSTESQNWRLSQIQLGMYCGSGTVDTCSAS